jgi:hypothetical protein
MLSRLLESPRDLAEVAARSYAHDNGFVKLVLVSGREGQQALRMHVWPAASRDEGNIHNHCWDFTSVVVKGQLDFQEFVVDEAGPIEAFHYAYDPSSDFEYALRPFGSVPLKPAAAGCRRVGELYKMSAETLHRTWGGSVTGTVTLLVQGAHRRAHADVYVTRVGGVPTESHNRPLTEAEIRRLIEDVLTSPA